MLYVLKNRTHFSKSFDMKEFLEFTGDYFHPCCFKFLPLQCMNLFISIKFRLTLASKISKRSIPAYDTIKEKLVLRSSSDYLWVPMVSGLIARLGTISVTLPLELLRTNLQSNHSKRGSIQVVTNIFKSGGIRSLWTGSTH